MSLIFISGVSGTGKSTLMHELRRRGEEAHDTDTECVRVSKTTDEILGYEQAKKEGYNWVYPQESLRKLAGTATAKNVFLLGITDNLQEVKNAADEFIWMAIPLEVLVQRLDSRQKEYGKSERERKLILDLYKQMSEALGPETLTLDATKPVEAIADDLLAHIRNTHTADREFFATSRNGVTVTYDPVNSHASTHFADTPQIRPFVKQIIENTDISGDTMEFDADTGQPLGMSDLVETDDSDEIVYAIRKNRDRPIRFTKSRQPHPSSVIAISLNRIDARTYDLYSAWLGPQPPPAPNSPAATDESRPFWSRHALAWGNQEIQPGTETKTCPW